LAGWVRNLDSGEVEAWAEGGREALDAFVAWLEKGPSGAQVFSVQVSPREVSGFSTFDIEF